MKLPKCSFGFSKAVGDCDGRSSSNIGVGREQVYMQVFLCTVVVVNYHSDFSLEAGIGDEHSHVLPIKRFQDKLYGQYRKFSGLCVAADINLLC